MGCRARQVARGRGQGGLRAWFNASTAVQGHRPLQLGRAGGVAEAGGAPPAARAVSNSGGGRLKKKRQRPN